MAIARHVIISLVLVGLWSASLAAGSSVCRVTKNAEDRQALIDELCPQPESPQPLGCSAQNTSVATFGGHVYKLHLERSTWFSARERCHECGYYLAQVGSQAELDFIKGWLEAAGIYTGPTDNAPPFGWYEIWVDGSSANHHGCWVWTYPKVAQWTLDEGFGFWATWPHTQPDHILKQHGGGVLREERASLGWGSRLDGNDLLGYEPSAYLCERGPDDEHGELPSIDQVDNAPCV